MLVAQLLDERRDGCIRAHIPIAQSLLEEDRSVTLLFCSMELKSVRRWPIEERKLAHLQDVGMDHDVLLDQASTANSFVLFPADLQLLR